MFSYSFDLWSDPVLYDLRKQDGLWTEVVMKDSIFKFHPYLQVQMPDRAAILHEHGFFIEGMEFNASIKYNLNPENPEDQKLAHRFFWSENQGQQPEMKGNFVSMPAIMMMLSAFRKFDFPKNKSFQGTISSVVNQVIAKYKTFPYPLQNGILSQIQSSDFWYQSQEFDYEFLQNLSVASSAIRSPKSPVFTFVNLNGEFYFATVQDLLEQQQPIGKVDNKVFEFVGGSTNLYDPFKIVDYAIINKGYPSNNAQYSKKVYSWDHTGTSNKANPRINDFLIRNAGTRSSGNPGVFAALQTDVLKNDQMDILYYGINDTITEKQDIQAYINSFYKDTLFPYRMLCTVGYNSKLVAGKTIETSISSVLEDKPVSTEYSDLWLVLSSQHFMDHKQHPWTTFEIGKSTVKLNPQHRYKAFLV